LTLKIRQYRPSDNDAVWELHRLALEPTGAMLPGGPWNDDDLKDIENEYINNGGDFLIGPRNKYPLKDCMRKTAIIRLAGPATQD
jgi:hypothetical protein